ncbi:hypothetical protein ACJX0J_018219, partial [Zea mays]
LCARSFLLFHTSIQLAIPALHSPIVAYCMYIYFYSTSKEGDLVCGEKGEYYNGFLRGDAHGDVDAHADKDA